jgi:6,7-dimethyl-8-ribityllumazine synthase
VTVVAFDIPPHAQRLAVSGRYDAIAGGALVLDGGIYRHEFVSRTVVKAFMPVQLSMDAPVFSAVLPPPHFHEQHDHVRFFGEHVLVKGRQLADAVTQTGAALASLPETEHQS